jgi:hypothetical protein
MRLYQSFLLIFAHHSKTTEQQNFNLVARGIYLDTVAEMEEVYTQNAFLDDPKKLSDFDNLYNFAENHASNEGRELDPNDAYCLVKEYEDMVINGNGMAVWQWFVFENNLMEEDIHNMLDPHVVEESRFPEAQSTAFFETRLWIHETWEAPSNFLERVNLLSDVPIWICQGLRDNVCPPLNAQHLVNEMRNSSRIAPIYARFIDSGHEDTDPVMEKCLKQSMNEFLERFMDF